MASVARMIIGLCLIGIGLAVNAQTPADITFSPNPPRANEAFVAHATVDSPGTGYGFDTLDGPVINGDTITVFFDDDCGIICTPAPIQPIRESLNLPALADGHYTLILTRGNPSLEFARITFQVGGSIHRPIPATNLFGAMLLAALALGAASFTLSARRVSQP